MLKRKKWNKKGFAFMTGLLMGIMTLFFFLAMIPTIISMFGMNKGSDSANCASYTDPNGLHSYNGSLSSNTLTCTIIDFGPGLIVLGVVFAVIVGIISGTFGQQTQQNPYQYQYG